MPTEPHLFTPGVQDATRVLHRKAVDMANTMSVLAQNARIYDKHITINSYDADDLAELIVALMGTNNTLLQLTAKAELSAIEACRAAKHCHDQLERIERLPLRRLIAWWLRQPIRVRRRTA